MYNLTIFESIKHIWGLNILYLKTFKDCYGLLV